MKITSASQQAACPHGGQASIGLFGLPGFNAPRQTLPRMPQPSRIKGALDSFSSDGLSAAHYRKPAVVVPAPAAAAVCLERNELGELVLANVSTLAMRAAAAFSEARLRSECEARFEAAASFRRAGAGHVEHLMVLEG